MSFMHFVKYLECTQTTYIWNNAWTCGKLA